MRRFWTGVLGTMLVTGSLAAEPTLVLTFTGDLMAHAKNLSMGNYADIYRGLAQWLQADDYSFINVETPLDPHRATSDYPRFNAKPAYAEAALQAGFEVFSVANNHSNDWGASSPEATRATLLALASRYRLHWSGLKSAADPIRLEVLETKGWRIGFVALTNLLNSALAADQVNFLPTWNVWTREVDPVAQEHLLDLVRRWSRGVDFLIVSLHDGHEYEVTPDPIQQTYYRRLVQAGVDILWGHHPHVLQPWVWVSTDRGRRLIFFSLGNFVSRQTAVLGPDDADSPVARKGDGALMRVKVGRTPSGPWFEVDPLPLNNYHDPVRGTVVLPTRWLAEEAPHPWRPYYTRRWQEQRLWSRPGD